MIEESALQQKSKANWIKLRVSNTKLFSALIKERTQRKQITELTSLSNKKLSEPKEIKEEIVIFYKGLMGSAAHTLPAVNKITMRKGPTISHQQRIRLCANVTEQEIYEGLSSIGNDKSPAVDGYNAYFFKKAQAGFILGRKIVDNIILAHELIKTYTRKNVSPRCMIKIDLQKAYDSVEWPFRRQMLAELGFPEQFITWVMECVQTVNYTVMINGERSEPFNTARGLR
nr:uncharacterized protein LOC104107108 [Nicotiana tomentosiformis]